jgi:predicted secreted hydrolase
VPGGCLTFDHGCCFRTIVSLALLAFAPDTTGDATASAPIHDAAVAAATAPASVLPPSPGEEGWRAAPVPPDEASWETAAPDYVWSFPRDHWPHPAYRTEWWYFTGHLDDAEGGEYGFQFTVFRVGLAPQAPALDSGWAAHALFMGHASITDVEGKRHVFADVLHREIPLLSGFAAAAQLQVVLPDPARDTVSTDVERVGAALNDTIAWARAAPGTDGRWTLTWNGAAFDFAMSDRAAGLALELETTPEKPLVFQGPGGLSRKGRDPGAASLYYSFTRLRTSGWIELEGRRLAVEGTAWMDKEFGSNQLTAEQVGWDWFSLQLEDGQDLMLYVLRRRDGTVDFARGTWVAPGGEVRYLDAAEWSYEATGAWTSPRTGIRYPSGWRVRIPGLGLDLEVAPRVEGQENVATRSGGLAYWEGAVEVRGAGRRLGLGYVELTGYGKGNRPPI